MAETPPDLPGRQFERAGSFSYAVTEDRWEWSDAVARMYGYQPGTVTPTTELVLSHERTADGPLVADVVLEVATHRRTLAGRHRIIDCDNDIHLVNVVGEPAMDDECRLVGVRGFYIDVTRAVTRDVQSSLSDAVADIERHRAVINQAKGIIMMTYGVDAERAFELLIWRSQATNVKLRRIADRLVADLSCEPLPQVARCHVDDRLMTAHQRTNSNSVARQ